MHIWKLSSKDGKGAWFARKSIHEGIGFDRFRKGLEVEFALSSHGVKGTEVQQVPGGGVESVRGIGCVERIGEKVAEEDGAGGGQMEILRMAAQFPGPTAAREFVAVCTRKEGKEGRGARWFMIVSRPVKAGEKAAQEDTAGFESVCPGREGEGFIRGEYESVEFIREIIPEGEHAEEVVSEAEEYTADEGDGEAEVVEEVPVAEGKAEEKRHRRKKHRRHHHRHPKEEAAPTEAAEVEPTSPPSSSSPSEHTSARSIRKDYPVEWVMLTRSDPGGNVPRWMVERGTPGSIVKDAEKFLNWLAGLSDAELGVDSMAEKEKEDVLQGQEGIAVRPDGKVVKEDELGMDSPTIAEAEQQQQDDSQQSEGLASSVFGIAAEMVGSLAPTKYLPNIPNLLGGGTNTSTDKSIPPSPPQRPSPPSRKSTDATSIQSFSTATQQPHLNSPPLTPPGTSTDGAPLTPSTTSSTTLSTSDTPPAGGQPPETKPLSRLLSQKSRLLARLEKALQKNRKGDDAEARLRGRYEEEVRKEEERYKRDMEKVGRRRERAAQKVKEKEEREREKERERERKERERRERGVRDRGASNASATVREAKEVVERLTRENEKLVRENEGLRRKLEEVGAVAMS